MLCSRWVSRSISRYQAPLTGGHGAPSSVPRAARYRGVQTAAGCDAGDLQEDTIIRQLLLIHTLQWPQITQLCILLGHMFINHSPVFSTMHHNAEILGPLTILLH